VPLSICHGKFKDVGGRAEGLAEVVRAFGNHCGCVGSMVYGAGRGGYRGAGG
jgi:hypothetical protein